MKKIKIVLLIIFLFLFFISIFLGYKVYVQRKEQKKIKEELIDIGNIPESFFNNSEIKINFNKLKEKNSDVVGWIVVDDTQINYPIVQGDDNSYYLNHAYNKDYNMTGSIFIDYKASADFSDFNTFIYGHNTMDGTMFGELYKYKDYNFFLEHKLFYLYTPNTNYRAKIFSVYVDDATSESYKQNFEEVSEYIDYIKLIKEKSIYDSGYEFNYDKDKIITLYSCTSNTNPNDSKRYFIHAVLESINN